MTIAVRSRLVAALASAAALSLVASPVAARGWDGWGSRYHHRHRDGVDDGDVLAGILILGGIAAIASAAGKADKERRDRDDPYTRNGERREPRYGEPREGYGDFGSGRIGDAVDSCTYEVERSGKRVDSVDAVVREGDGWRVRGRVEDGRSFAFSVSESGRIGSVTIDGRAAWPDSPGGRYDR